MKFQFDLKKLPSFTLPLAAAIFSVLVVLLLFLSQRGAQDQPGAEAQSPLYTGNEAKRKVDIYYASKKKTGLEVEKAEIYLSASAGAQVKQVVLRMIETPVNPDAASVFPAGTRLRELFLDKEGLCVVDFDPAIRVNHPGGTTGEYLTIYALVRTLTANFNQIGQVQIMLNGEYAETLAGHLDISRPLRLSDF
jgi:spore germination protein GerM